MSMQHSEEWEWMCLSLWLKSLSIAGHSVHQVQKSRKHRALHTHSLCAFMMASTQVQEEQIYNE
jgi:hypothetical protein